MPPLQRGRGWGVQVPLQPRPPAPSSSSPWGKPHPSSLYHVTSPLYWGTPDGFLTNCYWFCQWEKTSVITIAKPHFRYYAINKTLFSALPSWERRQSYCRDQWDPVTFMFSQNNSLLFIFLLITKAVFNVDCRGILHCQCLLRISVYLWNTGLPWSTLFPSCWFFPYKLILIQTNTHLLNISATKWTCSNHNSISITTGSGAVGSKWCPLLSQLHTTKSHCYDLYQFMSRLCLHEFLWVKKEKERKRNRRVWRDAYTQHITVLSQ